MFNNYRSIKQNSCLGIMNLWFTVLALDLDVVDIQSIFNLMSGSPIPCRTVTYRSSDNLHTQ